MSARRPKRRLLKYLVLFAIGNTILLTGAVLLALRRPGWYRPAPTAREHLKRDKQDLVNLIDQIGAALNAGRPAIFRVREDQVNRWIYTRDQLPFIEVNTGPFQDICVDFEEGAARIAARVTARDWTVIIGAGVRIQPRGEQIRLTVDELRVGSLPVPASVVARLVGPLPAPIGDLPQPRELAWTAPNHLIWENGKQPFRVGAIQALKDELRITLEPLARR